MLRVSPRTVLNWIERDAIPYVALPQVGGSRRDYRIPLYGLLSSLSGNYDLGSQLEALSDAEAKGVHAEDLHAAEGSVQPAVKPKKRARARRAAAT
jgi:hypothetical protein